MDRVAIIVLAALVLTGAGFAEMTNHSELAQRIAETSANVGAGDVVVIDGGTHTIPLMEAIAMEAQKASKAPTARHSLSGSYGQTC